MSVPGAVPEVEAIESQPQQEKLHPEKGPFWKDMRNRWKEVMEDEEAVEGLKSLGRFGGNVLLAATELVPGAGEIPDWAVKLAEKTGLLKFELTPDINALGTAGIEAVDLTTGGILPSRAIETLVQASVDYKEGKFQKGIDAIAYVFTSKENFTEQLMANREKLDSSAAVFETAIV